MELSVISCGTEVLSRCNNLITSININRKLNLPDSATVRWTISKKAAIVNAFRRQAITLDEIQVLYPDISKEEFFLWCDNFERHDQKGLRVTQTQRYRREAGRIR